MKIGEILNCRVGNTIMERSLLFINNAINTQIVLRQNSQHEITEEHKSLNLIRSRAQEA